MLCSLSVLAGRDGFGVEGASCPSYPPVSPSYAVADILWKYTTTTVRKAFFSGRQSFDLPLPSSFLGTLYNRILQFSPQLEDHRSFTCNEALLAWVTPWFWWYVTQQGLDPEYMEHSLLNKDTRI